MAFCVKHVDKIRNKQVKCIKKKGEIKEIIVKKMILR